MKTYTVPPLIIADLEAMPDDGNRYELIEGELFASTTPTFFHQSILMRLGYAFSLYLREHPIGEVVPGVGVVFDNFNGWSRIYCS